MSDLSREEFARWMEVLRDDVKGVHERLDMLNGRTRKAETDIAILKDRGTRDPAARWTAIGSGFGAIVAGAVAWFSK